MTGKAFLDTNVLIYAFAENDPRSDAAVALLAQGAVIGVQTVNEFVAVSVRKIGRPWAEVIEALDAIHALFPSPVPVTVGTHDMALRIAMRHRYHIYDSLMIAAALEASCDVLYTEDMRDGQVIDGLMIRNPFGSL